MRRAFLLLPFALTACTAEGIFLDIAQTGLSEAMRRGGDPQPWKLVPAAPELEPSPPSKLAPARADFSFIDHSTGRTYMIWLYQDHEVLDQRVFVQEPNDYVRPASWDEAAFAYARLNSVWRHRDVPGKLEYLRQQPEDRQAIAPRLLDEFIHLKRGHVESLVGNALELEAQVRASKPDDANRGFLATRLGETYRDLNRARLELAALEGRKRALYETVFPVVVDVHRDPR